MGKESEKGGIYVCVYIYVCVCVRVYIYIYLNHFAVHQKQIQHCKSTILQFFKKDPCCGKYCRKNSEDSSKNILQEKRKQRENLEIKKDLRDISLIAMHYLSLDSSNREIDKTLRAIRNLKADRMDLRHILITVTLEILINF